MADEYNRSKVTMRSISLMPDGTMFEQTATDWVGADILDTYVADAHTRWQSVVVDELAEIPQTVLDADYAIPVHLETVPDTSIEEN